MNNDIIESLDNPLKAVEEMLTKAGKEKTIDDNTIKEITGNLDIAASFLDNMSGMSSQNDIKQDFGMVDDVYPYGDDIKFVDVKDDAEEKLAEGFVKGVFEIIELKEQNKKLQEMFAMQVKLVTALEVEKIELRNIIEVLTKGKLPCNPDHNGECLVCDNWLCDCPLNKNEKNS